VDGRTGVKHFDVWTFYGITEPAVPRAMAHDG